MKGVWIIATIWLLFILSVGNVVSYYTEGVVTDKFLLEAIQKERQRGVEFNEFSNGDIIDIGILPYITKTKFINGWLFKYRVDGVGMVPYWYKSADTLDKLYATCKIRKLTEREKLKLQ
jgi:hypothetical protein